MNNKKQYVKYVRKAEAFLQKVNTLSHISPQLVFEYNSIVSIQNSRPHLSKKAKLDLIQIFKAASPEQKKQLVQIDF